MNDDPLIVLRGISKSYGGVHALDRVSFDLLPGEVHAICGENGAGKSTLIKILTGVLAPDTGEILMRGQRLPVGSVERCESAGIAAMHQESMAFPHLNAVDNVFVGRELTRCRGWFLDRRGMRRTTGDILNRLGEQLPLDLPVGDLPLAQRQLVALARALCRDCKLLVMDESTASLSRRETRNLLGVIRQLRSDGVSVLYVSHRLEEIFEIADRVTVLRDGQWVATRHTTEIDSSELIRLMVGRELDLLTRRAAGAGNPGEGGLRVEHLTRRGAFHDVTLTVRPGEIVGLAGLVGAGRSELARAIFGIDRYDSGHVRVGGKWIAGHRVARAMEAGMALVPEDRQREGLVLPMTVEENISLAVLRQLTRCGLVRRRHERALVRRQMSDLHVKADSPSAPSATLSGGNQQKVVLGKWLAREPQVMILDEPTRGVDVGAKAQVHRLIHDLARQGMATLLISSDLPELLATCDRLLVMREGRIVGELDGNQASQEEVLALALPDGREVRP